MKLGSPELLVSVALRAPLLISNREALAAFLLLSIPLVAFGIFGADFSAIQRGVMLSLFVMTMSGWLYYAVTLYAFWFGLIGVWFLQPRVNKFLGSK